jgi:hypothetical protein
MHYASLPPRSLPCAKIRSVTTGQTHVITLQTYRRASSEWQFDLRKDCGNLFDPFLNILRKRRRTACGNVDVKRHIFGKRRAMIPIGLAQPKLMEMMQALAIMRHQPTPDLDPISGLQFPLEAEAKLALEDRETALFEIAGTNADRSEQRRAVGVK